MVGVTTPCGDMACLKRGRAALRCVGVEDTQVLDRVLRAARDAAGLAAYHYFFNESTADARAAYLAALEAEAEAELLSIEVRGSRAAE